MKPAGLSLGRRLQLDALRLPGTDAGGAGDGAGLRWWWRFPR